MMPYNRKQARELLTAAEFELFEHSLAGGDKALTTARLRAKVARARRLRDKFQDLYRRQRLALRGATGAKGGRSGAANARTQRKAVVFGEVLARLQARLAEREAADARAANKAVAKVELTKRVRPAKPAPRGPQRTRSPKAPAKAAPKSSVPATAKSTRGGPPAAQRGNPLLNPRNRAISAHVRSQGRRNQARRDRR